MLRQHRWNDLNTAAQQVLIRDTTTATAAALLPMLAAAAEATRGTDDELLIARSHARARARLYPQQAEGLFSRLLDTAVARDQHGSARFLAGDLIDLYQDSGRLDEALALAGTAAEYTRRAGYGPWTQLLDQGTRLQILGQQGHYQEVLDTVEDLRVQMATLPDPPDRSDRAIITWNVRETFLNTGVTAAIRLGRWQQALDLNSENVDSKRRRGATDAEQAVAAFNDYGSLLSLGRVTEARDLLIRCRAVHEATNNIPSLGMIVGALAEVENRLGHRDRAISLVTDALRLNYLAADPDVIGAGHNNLASYLARDGREPPQIWAHRLAAAVISYQTGSGNLPGRLRGLAGLLTTHAAAAPETFAQVCQLVDQIDGVHLADLLARLPRRAPDGQAAMIEVLRLAAQAGVGRTQQFVAAWEPVLSALHASLRHPDPTTRDAATQTLEQALAARAQQPDWQALVAALRRIHAGEYDPGLLDGLDHIDTAITRRALDLLDGTATTDPDAWHRLTRDADDAEADQSDRPGTAAPPQPPPRDSQGCA